MLPPVLLILGTDLAGKDHFANVLTDAAAAAGMSVERRRGLLSRRPDHRRTSEGKGLLNLWLEWTFLATLPFHCRFLPYLVSLLLWIDIKRFRPPASGSLLVVSHTPIRLLAFALGHLFDTIEEIKMLVVAEKALRAVVCETKARTVVLDIHHDIRMERMQSRSQRGTGDYFDRYMSDDPIRSERIESFLVFIGVTYLGAVRIENNNLTDVELLACLAK